VCVYASLTEEGLTVVFITTVGTRRVSMSGEYIFEVLQSATSRGQHVLVCPSCLIVLLALAGRLASCLTRTGAQAWSTPTPLSRSLALRSQV
jgi:hypothetical protein